MLKKLLPYIFVGAATLFLLKAGLGSWQEISDYYRSTSIDYFFFSISIGTLIVGMCLSGLVWGRLVLALDKELKVGNSEFVRIFVYSIFARYIPGKAWEFAGRSYLARKSRVDLKVSFASVVYELIFLTVVGGVLLLIFPKLVTGFINVILGKIKKDKLSPRQFLSRKDILKFICLYIVIYFFIGLAFSLMVRSVVPSITYLQFFKFGAEYITALILGTIAVFAPAGLGIREGVLVLLLQNDLPLGIAVFISILSRGWTIISEIILLAAAWVYFENIRRES